MLKLFANDSSIGIYSFGPFDGADVNRGRIIDWLIFNAGLAEVVALDWATVIYQLFTDPIMLHTVPQYLIERVGTETEDGIGSIFQANVFGHYYIVHSPRI